MLRIFAGSLLVASATIVAGHAVAADVVTPPITPLGPPPLAIDVPPPSYDVLFGLYGGAGKIQADDELFRIFGFEGSVNLSLGTASVFIDGRGENGFETTADTYGGTQAGAHLYMFGRNNLALGVLGAISTDQNDDDWNIHGLIGGEAAVRSSIFAFAAQGGWVGTLETEGFDRLADAGFVRGMAQVFLPPSFKAQIEAAFLNGRFDSDFDRFHMVTLGAEFEYKFSPRGSAFVSWDGQWTTDDTWGGTKDTSQVLGGVRFALGGVGGMGVPMGTPNIIRWNAIAANNN